MTTLPFAPLTLSELNRRVLDDDRDIASWVTAIVRMDGRFEPTRGEEAILTALAVERNAYQAAAMARLGGAA